MLSQQIPTSLDASTTDDLGVGTPTVCKHSPLGQCCASLVLGESLTVALSPVYRGWSLDVNIQVSNVDRCRGGSAKITEMQNAIKGRDNI